MKDSGLSILFKVAGVLHAIAAVLMVCVFITMIITLVTGTYAASKIASVGESVEFPIWYVISAMLISGILVGLYSLSCYGFFKLKKYQPIVFTAVVVLSVIEFAVSVIANGFQLMNIGTIFFLLLWIALLAVVWMKKEMFKN